jgi:ubiquinone/menaquinone biosynthesis C-methylase UbiE
MGIFFDLYHHLPRAGPGDNRSTRTAWSLLTDLPPRPLLLDIGCGPGMQSCELASQTLRPLIALDTHRPFLTQLKRQAHGAGMADRIVVLEASMFALPFQDRTFDVIWSEGAMYIMGLARALQAWRRVLKPRGYLVVSELSWLQPDPPAALMSYWHAAYPGMQTIAENMACMRDARYRVMGHFVLPSQSWWETYYTPLEKRLALLRDQYRGHAAANQQMDAAWQEMAYYRQYADWYGYVFYIMQSV